VNPVYIPLPLLIIIRTGLTIIIITTVKELYGHNFMGAVTHDNMAL